MLKKLKSCPSKTQSGLGFVFETWAGIVFRCPILTLCIALLCFGYAGSGYRWKEEYTDAETPLTPKVRSTNHNNLKPNKFLYVIECSINCSLKENGRGADLPSLR